jgi:diguanylate cyclase (GGDEF)-like protein
VPTYTCRTVTCPFATMPPATDTAELLAASERARERGDHRAGVALAEEAVSQATAVGDIALEARALALVTIHRTRLDDVEAALAAGLAALDRFVQLGDIVGQVRVLSDLVLAHVNCGLTTEALEHGTEALRLARKSADPRALCWALCRVALVHDARNQPLEAVDLLERALVLARELDTDEEMFGCLNNLVVARTTAARNARANGTDAKHLLMVALDEAEQARHLAESTNNLHRATIIAFTRSSILVELSRFEDAFAALAGVLASAREHGFAGLELQAEIEYAVARRRSGDRDGALHMLTDLLPRVAARGEVAQQLAVRTALYEILKERGRFERALEHHEHVMILRLQHAEQVAGAQSRLLLGRLELDQARYQAELEHKRAEELHHMAHVDSLTGLANRRGVDTRVPEMVGAGHRSLAAAIIDIDHFKKINDSFGHDVGDRVLAKIGELLQAVTRRVDLAARTGGEEFLVVLVNISLDGCALICDRLRTAIARYDWGSVAPGLAVTVSIGLTEYSRNENERTWLARADSALYDAKRNGRDRLVTSRHASALS